MISRVLFYPTIDIPNEDWLKPAYLFWAKSVETEMDLQSSWLVINGSWVTGISEVVDA
jgi:hypothetical protein